jgi:hypothetical protein
VLLLGPPVGEQKQFLAARHSISEIRGGRGRAEREVGPNDRGFDGAPWALPRTLSGVDKAGLHLDLRSREVLVPSASPKASTILKGSRVGELYGE